MVINTRDFGNIEIDENDIIHFPHGIYGFEDIKEYVILEQNDDNPVMWMQAIHDVFPSFVILDSFFITEDYNPIIPKDILKELKVSSQKKLKYFVIAVVPTDIKKMTVNLKSPVVVNFEKKIAMQVILENSNYPIRHMVFQDDGMVK